jgi:hypothetical protein
MIKQLRIPHWTTRGRCGLRGSSVAAAGRDAGLTAAAGGRTARSSYRKAAWLLCLALANLLATASLAPASIELRIQITGLNFQYDESQGGSLFDATSIAGGHGDAAEATPVTRIEFYLGNQLVGALATPAEDLFCDFLVRGIYNIPKKGGAVSTASHGLQYGFDLLSSTRGRFLALTVDTALVTYTRNQLGSYVQFSFVATGPSAGVVFQDLPFDLAIDAGQPISVRIASAKVTDRVEDSNYVLKFSSINGTGAVYGVVVPEPASFAALLGMGVIGLELRAWRKRRRNPVPSRIIATRRGIAS